MSRGKKDFINVNRDELLKDLKWGKSSFENRFQRFCTAYGFIEDNEMDIANENYYNLFKKDPEEPNSEYTFSWEWYPLFLALLRVFPEHPFFRENAQIKNMSSQTIIHYYEKLFTEIEQLPNHLKYEIMSHSAFQSALKEKYAIKHLSDKIAEFITAIALLTNEERPDIMIEIYKKLDEWIYNAFENNYALELARKGNHDENDRLIDQLVEREAKFRPLTKSEAENVRGYIKAEEEFKLTYLNQSQLDLLLVQILNKYILNDKLYKPARKLTPEEKKLRRETELSRKLEKEKLIDTLLMLVQHPNQNDQQTIPDDVEIYALREAYETFLLKSLHITESQMAHIDSQIMKIEECTYVNKTVEKTIQTAAQEFEAMDQAQKEETKRKYIENRRAKLEAIIEGCQKELQSLESDDSPLKDRAKYQTALQKEYIRFYERVRNHSTQYTTASESFLGQLIARAFHFSDYK